LRERCAGDGDFVIGFVGSFFSFEGLPLLLEVFAQIRSTHPKARLVLVGDGEDAATLKRLVTERGLEKSVWLTGRVPHSTVVEFYAAMDVLVYPRYHSMLTDMISPLKPLEPMAMARCVVGSDVGGIRELIRDGETGLLFRAGSPDDLKAKLALLLSGQVDASALGERARQHVVAERQWEHMAQAYEHAYTRARSRLIS
jgi:glycosyltransferase involved in cell wall biosynthesis